MAVMQNTKAPLTWPGRCVAPAARQQDIFSVKHRCQKASPNPAFPKEGRRKSRPVFLPPPLGEGWGWLFGTGVSS